MGDNRCQAPIAEVTVVEAEACHFCADAQRVVTELSSTYPLHLLTVQAHTAAGRGLLATHRAALFPLVLLDGAFFSQGRLPRRKLEHELARRTAYRRVGDPWAIS
jgi:glutaredoxin